MTAYAAHLRVYEPLAAFAGAERRQWESYVADDRAPSLERGLAMEHEAGLRALVGVPPPSLPDLPEHAYVSRVDGVVLVCPWRTRLRAWEAIAERDQPELLAGALPPAVAEQAERSLQSWREQHPDLRAHVRSSTWQVPLRWFVLVDAEEREVRAGAPGTGSGAPPGRRTGRSLLYRTAMSRARRRVARALSVLRSTVEDGTVTAAVEDLGRWLEEFHPRAMVELDYGGLVHLLDDNELAGDESAADVAAALAALGAGRGEDAAAAYARVTARMTALQAVESAN